MELLLLRHGQAEDHSTDGTDHSRGLTDKGFDQAKHVARILKAADSLPNLVLCSPLLRTRQTADAFTTAAGIPGPVTESWLACGMSPEIAMKELAAFPDFPRVMIVGHEPDFSQLIQYLLGAAGGSVEVRKGSVTCLEIRPPSRRATLRFLVPFKLAKHLDRD